VRRSRLITFLASAALIPLSAMAVAACGGASAATSPPASSSRPTAQTSRAASATVGVANSGLGSILVDSHGRTLYLWQADTGPKSTCSGACAAAWPPLMTNRAPTAGRGAKASLLGTTKRSDGAEQVTYNQHPLYLFTGDTASGHRTRLHRLRRTVVRALARRQPDHGFRVHECPSDRIESVRWLLTGDEHESLAAPAASRPSAARPSRHDGT
jgi:predicted lipoprotein with Yx(FWY)xxD motif